MTKLRGPGPNNYALPTTVGWRDHDPTKERAPACSFGSRYSYSYNHGPGPYYIPTGMSNKGMTTGRQAVLYGRPKRSIWESGSNSSPGPVYSVNDSQDGRRGKSYSFGAPYKTNYNRAGPGPNTYNVYAPFGQNSKGAILMGRTKDSKSFDYDFAKTPGPGQYGNMYNPVLSHGPAYTIGGRTQRPGNKLITPGPNTYNPPYQLVSPRAPGFHMGIKHHEDVLTLTEVSD